MYRTTFQPSMIVTDEYLLTRAKLVSLTMSSKLILFHKIAPTLLNQTCFSTIFTIFFTRKLSSVDHRDYQHTFSSTSRNACIALLFSCFSICVQWINMRNHYYHHYRTTSISLLHRLSTAWAVCLMSRMSLYQKIIFKHCNYKDRSGHLHYLTDAETSFRKCLSSFHTYTCNSISTQV
jgi:hypothetical protein